MLLLTALLSCSALVAAAPQILNKRDLVLSIGNRLSKDEILGIKTKTAHSADCWARSNLVWPMNDMPPPIADKVEANQLKLYTIPQTKPKTLTVRNYCSYKIFYQHVGSGGVLGNGTLEAGGTWATPTDIGGSNFKASKTEDLAKVVQVEYNRGAALWYNLSLIDCLARGPDGQRTKDATGCVGLEAGLQFGNKENKSFQCKPGTWCDDQAYFYPENMCKEINPVTNCAQDLGVTMEFCASKKS